MLRLLAALLLLANLAFWALTREDVAQALGLSSMSDREPGRLARQIHPEAVKVLNADGTVVASATVPLPASGASTSGTSTNGTSAPGATLACLESGALSEAETVTAVRELQLAGVPAGAWVDMRRELPGSWLLYMGRFADREQARRKAVELQRMSLPYEELLDVPELSPGLVLARFDNDAEAQARLAQLRGRGVRTAKVVQQSAARVEHRLRIDRLPPERRARLQALNGSAAPLSPTASAASAPASAPGGSRWSACAPAP